MPSSHCSRCSRCGHPKSSSSSSSDDDLSAVTLSNRATLLGVDSSFLRKPRMHGSVFNVAFGRNYAGDHQGDVVAVKWPRADHHCRPSRHFAAMFRAAALAAELILHFTREVDARGWTVVMVEPKLWRSDEGKGRSRTVVVEPCLHPFEKFNSNSGWRSDTDRTFNKVAQALSHFSYVWSEGKYILCDLQGTVREEQKVIVITDPCILSREEGRFGCTDMGKEGMSNFFKHHQCSGICRHFAQPKDRKVFFRPVRETLFSS